MLRGAQVVSAGGAVIRAASAGLIGVGVTGEVTVGSISHGVNRARAWCQQRRGRQTALPRGLLTAPVAMSIHSNLSSSMIEDRAQPKEIADKEEAQKWKTAYGSLCRDHQNLQ